MDQIYPLLGVAISSDRNYSPKARISRRLFGRSKELWAEAPPIAPVLIRIAEWRMIMRGAATWVAAFQKSRGYLMCM